MNIQRFVLPATIAAAFHAVLLCALPEITIPQLVIDPIISRQPKPPEIPHEAIEPPPVLDPDTEKEVVPLGGGTPRPELPEMLNNSDATVMTVPVESRPTERIKIDNERTLGVPGIPGPGSPDGQPKKITMADNLDKVPRARVQMPPDYPATMKRDKIDGTVMVEFDVDVNGRVTSARVRESTHRAFEEPTIRAVLKWRFEPGISHGLPVPFRMVIPVNFKLGES